VKLQTSRVEAGHDSLSQVDVDSFLVSDHSSSCQILSHAQFPDSDLKSGLLPLLIASIRCDSKGSAS
jgi:hypothetical protein